MTESVHFWRCSLQIRSLGYRSLHEGVRVLFVIWGSLAWSEPQTWSSKDESLCLIYNRARTRCRRVLEHLFLAQSAEVFESIVECWNRELLVCCTLLLTNTQSSTSTGFENSRRCCLRARRCTSLKFANCSAHGLRKYIMSYFWRIRKDQEASH